MQIRIGWTCRECEEDQELVTDTSNYAVLCHPGGEEGVAELVVRGGGLVSVPIERNQVISAPAEPLELRCASCGHVSGEVGLGYSFQPEYAPSWER